MGEGADLPEARCHLDRVGVYATGIWGEGDASYSGRSTHLPTDSKPKWPWASYGRGLIDIASPKNRTNRP